MLYVNSTRPSLNLIQSHQVQQHNSRNNSNILLLHVFESDLLYKLTLFCTESQPSALQQYVFVSESQPVSNAQSDSDSRSLVSVGHDHGVYLLCSHTQVYLCLYISTQIMLMLPKTLCQAGLEDDHVRIGSKRTTVSNNQSVVLRSWWNGLHTQAIRYT